MQNTKKKPFLSRERVDSRPPTRLGDPKDQQFDQAIFETAEYLAEAIRSLGTMLDFIHPSEYRASLKRRICSRISIAVQASLIQ